MKKLGRYELLEPLGQGGMGEVWLARLSGAAGFEKPCIVKTVLPGLTKDPQFVARFQHEAKVLVHLQHSNIASVYDMGEADGALFMALEYVAGVDLQRLLQQVSEKSELLPVPVALFIAQHAAEALGYAHRKTATDGAPLDLVHRDVSPHNLMVSFEGEVKVIDFGIARSSARVHSTQAATVMGKLGYMAPEQALAKPIDARADQYALGVVLWEMLTGQPYVPIGTGPEMLAAMSNPSLRPLSGTRTEIDSQLEKVVLRALQPDVAARYESCDAFALALAQELMRFGGAPPKSQIGQWVKSRCSDAYQANQQLLSKVSSMRRADLATAVDRPTGEKKMANPPDLNTDAAMKAAMKPNRTPMIVGLVAVLVIGGGIAAAMNLLGSKKEDPKPAPVAEKPAEKPVEPKPAPPPVEPEKKTEAVVPPPAVVAAVVADAGAPAAVAAPVAPDAGVALPSRPRVTSKKVVDLFIDKDQPFASAGSADGVKVGVELKVVTAIVERDQREVLGTATVLEVFPKMSRLRLDPAATAATGTKFVALDASPTSTSTPPGQPAQPAQPAVDPNAGKTPAPAANRTLAGNIALIGSPERVVKLFNTGKIGWSNCSIYIPGQYKWTLKSLPAGAAKEMPLRMFTPDPSAPRLENQVKVDCAQGSMSVNAQ